MWSLRNKGEEAQTSRYLFYLPEGNFLINLFFGYRCAAAEIKRKDKKKEWKKEVKKIYENGI